MADEVVTAEVVEDRARQRPVDLAVGPDQRYIPAPELGAAGHVERAGGRTLDGHGAMGRHPTYPAFQKFNRPQRDVSRCGVALASHGLAVTTSTCGVLRYFRLRCSSYRCCRGRSRLRRWKPRATRCHPPRCRPVRSSTGIPLSPLESTRVVEKVLEEAGTCSRSAWRRVPATGIGAAIEELGCGQQ